MIYRFTKISIEIVAGSFGRYRQADSYIYMKGNRARIEIDTCVKWKRSEKWEGS